MVRYWILRRESPPTKFETASWFWPRKGKIKQVKFAILNQAARSVRKPSIRKIMASAMSKRYCTLQGVGERESGYKPDNPLLSTTHDTKKTGTVSSGKTRRSLFPRSDKSSNETCPKAGIIYTQNVQGLSGKVHFEGLVHLLRYIRYNKTLGLKYYSDLNDAPVTDLLRQASIKTKNHLMLFSDSSWKDCLDTGRSTGAYIIFYQGGPIDHGTHVPGPVAQSSA